MKKKITLKKTKKYPKVSHEGPVSEKLLFAVRDELKSGLTRLEYKLNAHDKRFDSVDKRFDQLQLEMKSEFEKMAGLISKSVVLNEEQNNRNKIVYEALDNTNKKLERVEFKVGKLEKLKEGI